MYLNKRPFRTVAARLTFWYATTCTLLAAAAFTMAYIRLDVNIARDIDKELFNELHELRTVYTESGLEALQKAVTGEAESKGVNHVFIRLLSPQKETLAISDLSEWAWLPMKSISFAVPAGSNVVFSTLYPNDRHQNTRIASIKVPGGSTLQIGLSLHSNFVFLKKFRRIFITFSCATFLLSIISGRLIARRTMAGVRRVTRAASRIRKDNLNSRIPFGSEGQEIVSLAKAFNEMLERIEALVRELKEVSDNVAHDLRSPITRMRGVAETTLTGPQEIEAYREMGLTIIEESERLTQIINTTLEIAQAESGLLEIQRTPLDMTVLLKNAAELFQPAAEEKQLYLRTNLPDDPLFIFGDKTRLQRVVSNLIDNAIKYTLPGGKITLAAFTHGNLVRIEISDTGQGIAPEENGHIFERFYRSEKSRSSQGNGLGLSLAKTIVHAHGGNITVQSTLGKGSTFTVTLPRGSEQA